MLQRDPKRRVRLPELRRQLAQLEVRMEEAEKCRASSEVHRDAELSSNSRHRSGGVGAA